MKPLHGFRDSPNQRLAWPALRLLYGSNWGCDSVVTDRTTVAYSDTWQLVINTGTTIITFLMVFLIQNTQNRDAEAVQIKLDELIRVTKGAHNALMNLEELGEEEFTLIREKYKELAEVTRAELEKGKEDTRHTYSVRKRCHIYSCFLTIGLAVADEVISSRRRRIGPASDSRFDILVYAE